MSSEVRTTVRHFFVYGLGRMSEKLISFLMIPLFTAALSPSDFGVMEILNLATMLAGVVLCMNVSFAMMRSLYSETSAADRDAVTCTAFVYYATLAGVSGLLAWTFRVKLAIWLLGSSSYAPLIAPITVVFMISCLADVPWMYLRARQQSGRFMLLNQASAVLSMTAIVYLVLHKRWGVAGVFWGQAIGTGTVAVVLVVLVFRATRFSVSWSKLKAMIKFGAPLAAVGISGFLLNFLDRFFLEKFASLEAVGLYAVAYKFGFIISVLMVQPFQTTWEPQAYSIANEGNVETAFPRILTVYTVGLFAAAYCISMFIPEVFSIVVDRKFGSAYAYVPLIAFGYVAQGIGRFWESPMLIAKRTKVLGKIGIFGTAFSIALNAILISVWHAWGAAVATFGGFLAIAAATYLCSRRVRRISFDWMLVAKLTAVCAVFIAAGWMLPFTSLLARIACKSALSIALVATVFAGGVLRPWQAATIRAWVEQRLPAWAKRKQGAAAVVFTSAVVPEKVETEKVDQNG